MTNVVILGAGVMGSALAVPAADAGNSVTVIGSPLDDSIIASVNATRHHPGLNLELPKHIAFVGNSEADTKLLCDAELVVIGVSSPGVQWATEKIQRASAAPPIVSLVTKGLVARDDRKAPYTYADTLQRLVRNFAHTDASGQLESSIVGIGGPCIARELALRVPTRVTFASQDIAVAEQMRGLFSTPYYRITTDVDIVSVEACAALKNFLCIGVSAMTNLYEIDTGTAKNPLAGLFNQAVHELLTLSQWISADSAIHCDRQSRVPVAFDLAGMGDLHVTVGGGRNSRLGNYLGQGIRLSAVLSGAMQGVTVEGVDTGRSLSSACRNACESGQLEAKSIPLTLAILNSIDYDEPFKFDFGLL